VTAAVLGKQPEFEPGADANHKQFTVDADRVRSRRTPPRATGMERHVENQVVDGRPAAVVASVDRVATASARAGGVRGMRISSPR